MPDLKQLLGAVPTNPTEPYPGVYGAEKPNDALKDPAYVAPGSTNFWGNNLNFAGSWTCSQLIQLNVPIQAQTEFVWLSLATRNINVKTNSGTAKVQFSRMRPISPSVARLKEGQLPPKKIIGTEVGYATYASFGAWLEYTNRLVKESPLVVPTQIIPELYRSAKLSQDMLLREWIYMGSSHAYVHKQTSIDGIIAEGVKLKYPAADADIWKNFAQRGSQLTVSDIRDVINNMIERGVKPYIGTSWLIVMSNKGYNQLKQDPDWLRISAGTALGVTNWGSNKVYTLDDLMIVVESQAKRVKGTADKTKYVEVATIIGGEGFYTVSDGNLDPVIINKPLGSGGISDPMNMVGTLAWVLETFGAAIPNTLDVVSLHYATDEGIPKMHGVKVDPATGKPTYDGAYDYTSLDQGFSLYWDLEDIDLYDTDKENSSVFPYDYPTTQDDYIKDKSPVVATRNATDPAAEYVIGQTADLADKVKAALIAAGLTNPTVVDTLNILDTSLPQIAINTVITNLTIPYTGTTPTADQLDTLVAKVNPKLIKGQVDYTGITATAATATPKADGVYNGSALTLVLQANPQ